MKDRLRLSSGMVFIINPAEPLPADMGVNLGGGYLTVSEHQLDRPQVRSSLQEMGSERMAQDVRTYLLNQACLLGVSLQKLPESLSGESIPSLAQKQVFTRFF